MGIFFEGRPKFTMNVIVLVVSLFQGIMLLSSGCSFGDVCYFAQTGMPNPSVCGPLFLTWVVVCALYWTKIVKSPKLSTIVAAVFVYFGTMTLAGQLMGMNNFGGTMMFIWATSVHVMEAYIGYAYFIESAVRKLKLW